MYGHCSEVNAHGQKERNPLIVAHKNVSLQSVRGKLVELEERAF